MEALSKAESLVSLISSALLSRPTLPINKTDELAQNISMVSLTEQDIENILNDTHMYENATRALNEAWEALEIATTARLNACVLVNVPINT